MGALPGQDQRAEIAAVGPVGPLPVFHLMAPDGTLGDPVPRDAWALIWPPGGDLNIDPPSQFWRPDIEELARQGVSANYGPSRLGRKSWFLASDGDRRPVTGILPRTWEPGDLAFAYSAALRFIRKAGFRLGAKSVWVFRDERAHWWALHGEPRLPVHPKPDSGPRHASFGFDRDSLIGFLNDAAHTNGGMQSYRIRADAPPPIFWEAFGGVYGPLHRAFIVAEIGRSHQDAIWGHKRELRTTRALLKRPEWADLRAAVERDWPNGGGLRLVVSLLEGELWNGPKTTWSIAHALGFEAGAALGYLQAAAQIVKHEAERVKKQIKHRYDAELLSIIRKAREQGPIKPYSLAAEVAEDMMKNPAHPLRQRGINLPTSQKSLGKIITDLAEAHHLREKWARRRSQT